MNRPNYDPSDCRRRAPSGGTVCTQRRRRAYGLILVLMTLVALLLGGCGRSDGNETPVSTRELEAPSTPTLTPETAETAEQQQPNVTIDIQAPSPIHPGQLVLIAVKSTSPDQVNAYRLTIGEMDTGWRTITPGTNDVFGYEWTAGEPGSYKIVAQARDQAGHVSEAQQTLEVEAQPPTETPEPTANATPTAASGSAQAWAVIQRSMNVRSGPGTDYLIIATVKTDERYRIIGKTASGEWLQISLGSNREPGWVFAQSVIAENAENVPVVVNDIAGTPTPETTDLAPAPAPVGTVTVYETSVTLPTYPYERYQTDAFDTTYNWPYKRFDWERFRADNPAPENREYRVLVLENSYLKVSVLPELGGRIWQVLHKPTGSNMFYQNPVLKPTSWGPPEQQGWFALGGLEWDLPVVEHGYDWGTEWGHLPLQHSPELASITVFTPQDGRWLNASITISLRAGAASFEVEPTITNFSTKRLEFAYWHSALLAPGSRNRPSHQLHFVLPGDQMTVHSTGDPRLPKPGEPFRWPVYNGTDFSWLGNWSQYLGFFERPGAHGPFAAIYDYANDAGAARIYPALVARGSKVFGLGWQQPLPSELYTDDNSSYVELHGGLMPTFDDKYELPPSGSVTWREIWYPVTGIGGLTYADEVAAINVYPGTGGMKIGLYPTRPMDGTLIIDSGVGEPRQLPLKISPDAPLNEVISLGDNVPASGALEFRIEDTVGHALFNYTYTGPLK